MINRHRILFNSEIDTPVLEYAYQHCPYKSEKKNLQSKKKNTGLDISSGPVSQAVSRLRASCFFLVKPSPSNRQFLDFTFYYTNCMGEGKKLQIALYSTHFPSYRFSPLILLGTLIFYLGFRKSSSPQASSFRLLTKALLILFQWPCRCHTCC